MISQSFRKHSPRIAGTVGCLTFSLSVFTSISLFTNMAHADWSSEKLYRGYNQSFGAFPPIDIDHRLSVSVEMTNKSASQSTNQSANKPVHVETSTRSTRAIQTSAKGSPVNQPPALSQQTYLQQIRPQQRSPQQRALQQRALQQGSSLQRAPQQGYQQPAYGVNNQRRNYNPQQNQNGNRSTGFNGPWNNSFGNNPSGSNGSGFNGPWNNSDSGFSMPWGNNGSGFNPMPNNMGNNMRSNKGNGGSWNW